MAYKRMLGKRRRNDTCGRIAKKFRRGKRKGGRRGRGRVYTKLMRQPVPDKMMTRLNYSEILVMSMTLGNVLYTYQFRNSIFDPDVTGGGHQPLWRDQLAALYTTYRVHGIKYKFTIANTNVDSLMTGCIKKSSDGVLDTNMNTLRERRSVQKFVCNHRYVAAKIVKGYMAVGKPHGLSKKDFMYDEDFEANIGGNPTKQSFLELYLSCVGSGAVAHVQVDLVYYVEFLNRQSVGGS